MITAGYRKLLAQTSTMHMQSRRTSRDFLKKWNWVKEHNTKDSLQMPYFRDLQGVFAI